MRIITGSARGVSLMTLPGEATRPTAERTKEAVFSMIQFDIEGRKVLDLFSGSGQLALEALSRGATEAVMCDSSREAVAIMKKNAENNSSRQVLLAPVTVTLSKSEYDTVISNLDVFVKAGYLVEDFGTGVVIIRECPMLISGDDIEDTVVDMAEQLDAVDEDLQTISPVNFGAPLSVDISDLTDSVSYIPLETTPESLLGYIDNVSCDDDYIVSVVSSKFLHFLDSF